MSERSKSPWIVNGKTGVGYRIDSMGEERTGMDFLTKPVAIVPKLEDANFIVELLDQNEEMKELLKDVLLLGAEVPGATAWRERVRALLPELALLQDTQEKPASCEAVNSSIQGQNIPEELLIIARLNHEKEELEARVQVLEKGIDDAINTDFLQKNSVLLIALGRIPATKAGITTTFALPADLPGGTYNAEGQPVASDYVLSDNPVTFVTPPAARDIESLRYSKPVRELCPICEGRGVIGEPITQCGTCHGDGTRERIQLYTESEPLELNLEACLKACEEKEGFLQSCSFSSDRDSAQRLDSLKFQLDAKYTNWMTGKKLTVPVWKSFDKIRIPQEDQIKIIRRLQAIGQLGDIPGTTS